MKVYELSKELNIDNKELIEILNDLGVEIKSHMNVIEDDLAEKVRNQFKKSWEADLNRTICLKNISGGKLVYVSKRQMGYQIEWNKHGDTNHIELGEFINLKNTSRRFVTEPWIRIIENDEIEILKYANILQYYKGILGIDNITDILILDFDKFKERFDNLPKGYQKTVAETAASMIKNGQLDSIKIKDYIEKTMDLDLSVLLKPNYKKKQDTINIE